MTVTRMTTTETVMADGEAWRVVRSDVDRGAGGQVARHLVVVEHTQPDAETEVFTIVATSVGWVDYETGEVLADASLAHDSNDKTSGIRYDADLLALCARCMRGEMMVDMYADLVEDILEEETSDTTTTIQ